MKFYQLIATAGFVCLSLFSCTDSANKEDNNLNKSPALDTVNIKPDTIKNFPAPLPESTFKSTDTIAQK